MSESDTRARILADIGDCNRAISDPKTTENARTIAYWYRQGLTRALDHIDRATALGVEP